MTCMDCLHYEVCKQDCERGYIYQSDDGNYFDNDGCEFFKNKAAFVHVPCGSEKLSNYKRIKKMDVNKLAEFLVSICSTESDVDFCRNKTDCKEMLKKNKEIPGYMCVECMKRYLKEVSGGDPANDNQKGFSSVSQHLR